MKMQVRRWSWMAILLGVGAVAFAQKPGEKPIGEVRTHGGGNPVKPIYKSDLEKDIDVVSAMTKRMAEQVKAVKLNPEKDSVEKMFAGSISLARHQADIEELKREFGVCASRTKNMAREKLDSGAATAEDKAKFDECIKHCDMILDTMESMHRNASMIGSATRQRYVLDGWDKHKKLMADLEEQMKSCPDMVKGVCARCAAGQKHEDGGHDHDHEKEKKK